MKGKKCFGVLLALPIIFGFSLNVYSRDSNALSKFSNSQITEIQYNSQNPDLYYHVEPFVRNSVTNNLSFNQSSAGVTRVSALQLNLQQDVKFGPNRGWRFYLGVKAYTLNDLDIVNLSCPTATGRFIVDSCNVLYGNTYGMPVSFYDNSQNPDFITNRNLVQMYMVVEGHSTYTEDTSLNSIQLASPFLIYGVSNSSSGYFNARFFTSAFETFEYDKTSEDLLNEKDNEDRDNLESQSSSTESSADSSSQDAENTGTTLLGAFSSFVTALTSASPSNCKLDMDLGNLDLGIVDLCQLSLPQPFPTIASIMLILFCVPLSIATARKVINLFRSFQ